jgi:hypothetical protein
MSPREGTSNRLESLMLMSISRVVAAAIAISVLSMPAFAGEQTSGRAAGNAESLRSVRAVFPSRKTKTIPAAVVDPTVASRDTPTAEEAAQVFTLVGHTRDGKEVRKLPSEDIIRSLTETRP